MTGETERVTVRAGCGDTDWRGVPELDIAGGEVKVQLESDHGWYRGRRRIVLESLERLHLRSGVEILDAGCGYGSMLDELARLGQPTGLEVNPLAVSWVRRHGNHPVLPGSVEHIPTGDRRFDLVTCLDVLEHVSEDRAALAELFRVTRPGGILVVTVPAYPSLWSAHDRAAGHRRRYRRRELIDRAGDAGWVPLADSHFNALLLPGIAVWRRASRHRGRARSDLSSTGSRLNRLLEIALNTEARWLAAGRRIPFGLSVLAVFRRPEEAT